MRQRLLLLTAAVVLLCAATAAEAANMWNVVADESVVGRHLVSQYVALLKGGEGIPATNISKTDTILRGTVGYLDTAAVTVVAKAKVGAATDTLTVADTLWYGALDTLKRTSPSYVLYDTSHIPGYQMRIRLLRASTDTLTSTIRVVGRSNYGQLKRWVASLKGGAGRIDIDTLIAGVAKIESVFATCRHANDTVAVYAYAPNAFKVGTLSAWPVRMVPFAAEQTIYPRKVNVVTNSGQGLVRMDGSTTPIIPGDWLTVSGSAAGYGEAAKTMPGLVMGCTRGYTNADTLVPCLLFRNYQSFVEGGNLIVDTLSAHAIDWLAKGGYLGIGNDTTTATKEFFLGYPNDTARAWSKTTINGRIATCSTQVLTGARAFSDTLRDALSDTLHAEDDTLGNRIDSVDAKADTIRDEAAAAQADADTARSDIAAVLDTLQATRDTLGIVRDTANAALAATVGLVDTAYVRGAVSLLGWERQFTAASLFLDTAAGASPSLEFKRFATPQWCGYVLSFDSLTSETAYICFRVPDSLAGTTGGFTVNLDWFCPTDSVGDAVWGFNMRGVVDGGSLDSAYESSGGYVVDAANGADNIVQSQLYLTNVFVPGDFVQVALYPMVRFELHTINEKLKLLNVKFAFVADAPPQCGLTR